MGELLSKKEVKIVGIVAVIIICGFIVYRVFNYFIETTHDDNDYEDDSNLINRNKGRANTNI